MVKFAKLISLHHNDMSAILGGHNSTMSHIRLALLAKRLLGVVKASDMAKHRLSLGFVQFGPGCSRRVHETLHSLDPSQPQVNY